MKMLEKNILSSARKAIKIMPNDSSSFSVVVRDKNVVSKRTY